jgi:hypothetical protein
LEYANGDIEEECYQIRHTEEHSDESNTLELKGKKENHTKVEDHPYKTLECIGQVEVLEPSTGECRIGRDDDRIGSSLMC